MRISAARRHRMGTDFARGEICMSPFGVGSAALEDMPSSSYETRKYKWVVGDALADMCEIAEEGKKIDLVIADPPYGKFPLINLAIASARELCSGPSFFFMYGEDLVELDSKPDQILFWVKTASTKNTKKRYSRFVETIAAYDLENSPFCQDTHWTTRSGTFIDQLTYRTHEFQKPVSLMEK